MQSTWGSDTQFFFSLTPHLILDTIEAHTDLKCTGRILALNSMENRVYEIEIINEQAKTPSERFVIGKFYRPGRWTEAQILEEHEFLADLRDNEIPVIQPLKFSDGSTLKKLAEHNIYFTIFPKQAGRSPMELSNTEYEMVGRLLGRMHLVGKSKEAHHRIKINPQNYGLQNMKYLMDNRKLPSEIEKPYQEVVEEICQISQPRFDKLSNQRIHGDCHFGNLIYGDGGMFWVDFDDMVIGPAIQDLWLIIPGRDDESKRSMNHLLKGYEMMMPFDDHSLSCVEALRALRFIHFNAWIAKRWADPSFPKAFPYFGTSQYWSEQLANLQEQLVLIKGPA